VFIGGDLCILCITLVSGLFILGVWVPGGFIGGPGHIFPVWDSAVWSAGPVQFIWVLAWSGWRDCSGFFYSGVNSPGGRLSVVGFCFSILVFLGYNWHYTRCCMLWVANFFLFVTGGTGRVGTWRTRSLCWSRRG
jgi:hypothetical protein